MSLPLRGSHGRAERAAEISVLLFCMGLLAVLLGAVMPPLDAAAPLPWDMSHHYLGALMIRDALAQLSPRDLSVALVESDLYPPGHSLLLGSWLAVAGESSTSLKIFLWFCLAALVGSMAWGISLALHRRDGRALLAGSVLLGACPRLLVLAGSWMTDFLACVLVLIALLLMARLAEGGTRHLIPATAAAAAAAILTKYNLGLPLLAVAGVLAGQAWRRNRRQTAYGLGTVAIAAVGIWALFLSAQSEGWSSFLRFAQNRANSLEWSYAERLSWYLHVGVDEYFVHPAVGWGALALAGMSLVRLREPLVLGLGSYGIITVLALARHPYLLSRNLVGVVAVGIVLAAVGSGALFTAVDHVFRLRWRVVGGAFAAAAAIALLVVSASSTQEQLFRSYRRDAPDLQPVSEFFLRHLPAHPSCRVIGTFDEFSPGWVRVLERQIPRAHRPHVGVGFPYPLPAARAGRDARPHRAYLETIRNWPASLRPELVLALEVEPSSPLYDQSFQRWSAWEINLVRALRNDPRAHLIDEACFPGSGVRVQALTLGHPPIEYVEGWGSEQSWGRWAMQRRARLRVPGPCEGQEIRFEVAAFDGQHGEQECTVFVNGEELHRFRIDGPAWHWQTERIRLPEDPEVEAAEIELRFAALHEDQALNLSPRALPFRTILVAERQAEASPTESRFSAAAAPSADASPSPR